MTQPSSDLGTRHCSPCQAGTPALTADQISERLPAVPGWELAGGELVRTFRFKNYYQTMAFVNAVAYIAHREDHHPDLDVGYNQCRVRYSTHAIGGLSENDFICAARVNTLLAG